MMLSVAVSLLSGNSLSGAKSEAKSARDLCSTYIVNKVFVGTVKGELGVASFLVNFFKRGPFLDISGCAPLPSCTFRYRC